jgi:hypothetical protein
MPKIKIDLADKYFSQWTRLRDKKCLRCHSPVRLNEHNLPVSHTNSHYFGRGAENTRFEPNNCDTLCYPCHTLWASRDREDYKTFKVNQLGQEGFDKLLLASNTYRKRDRISEKVYWKKRLKDDYNTKG